ncbi:MAG: ATP-binding protein [Phycisphaerae bacterium]|nr:ATP-binding protein [Phycisphaerae bacterium]
MPLPSKPFADWTKEDLGDLIADPPAVETARLDFKADCKVLSEDKKEKEKARRDILVDVSAMANGAGGALLIGVRQSGKPGAPPFAEKIEGVEDVERLKQTIKDLVNTHLDVRPGSLEYRVILYEDDLSVLIVEVPANTYCLSMITHNQCNQFRIRRGTDNRFMTTDEIEYKFGQFAKVRDSASDELEKIRSQLQRSEIRPMVWFAGVPIGRARDHVPVHVRGMRDILKKSSYFIKHGDRRSRGCHTPFTFADALAPSIRGLMTRKYKNSSILEIRRDGVVVFGTQLPVGNGSERLGNTHPKVEREVAVLWIYEPILSGLHLLADIQDRFSIGKVALVQAGLIDVQNTRIVRDDRYDNFDAPILQDREVILDAILLDEHWNPKKIFLEWATQLANELEQEEPPLCPPWIDVQKG